MEYVCVWKKPERKNFYTPIKRFGLVKCFCLVVSAGQQHASLSTSILNTVIFIHSWASSSLAPCYFGKSVCVRVCVCGFWVYLGATFENVCFALFILFCPTPSLTVVASSSGPHLIPTDCPVSFDSMRNKTLMEITIYVQVWFWKCLDAFLFSNTWQ